MKEQRVEQLIISLTHHNPTEATQELIKEIRAAGIEYVKRVSVLLPDNRDSSIWATEFTEVQRSAIASVVVPQ